MPPRHCGSARAEGEVVTTPSPRERATILLQEMRSAGCTFTLNADGQPSVRLTEECPMTPALKSYLAENRQAVVEILLEEQGLAPDTPAPRAQTPEPAPPRAMVERDNLRQPLVIPPGGGAPVIYRRCTEFIAVLEDRQWLLG